MLGDTTRMEYYTIRRDRNNKDAEEYYVHFHWLYFFSDECFYNFQTTQDVQRLLIARPVLCEKYIKSKMFCANPKTNKYIVRNKTKKYINIKKVSKNAKLSM